MKNFLSVLSSTLHGGVRGGLLFLALLTTSSLWAYDFQSGDLYYYITSDTIPYTAEVTYQYRSNINYSGLTEIIIPSSVTYNNITYTVTSIGESAFEYCSNLTSITIPNSVTNIGGRAFLDCSSLTSITIPNSITSIGWFALNGCSSITSITIPESVTGIGSGAFKNTGFYNDKSNWDDGTLYIDNCLIEVNQSLSGAYTIKDSTRVIADDAFDQCYKLTSITIPESVVSIGKQAFYGCSSLASIIIPNSVTVIGEEAFRDCSVLTSITIPKGVTSIGESAFDNCFSLTSVVWNAINCKDFGSSNALFYHFDNISYQIISFTFGDCVEHIPAYLCYQMVKLQYIVIPESVTSIGEGAFYGCSSLTSATIGNSVTNIGEDAFRGCSSLISITIPNSVTSIGEYAFADCFSLSNMTIGNSVTSIGYAAFRNCSALTSITIPNSVTSIGDPDAGPTTKVGAFYGCSSLTSVVWNATNYENITETSNSPFRHVLSQITSFTFGDNVEFIPQHLCYGMDKLKSIVIPNSVTSIGYNAFGGCKKLFDIYCYPTTPPEAQENSFTNYNVNLYVPCESLKDYQMDIVFGSFKYIQCLEDTPPSEPQDTTIYHPTEDATICEGDEYYWRGMQITEAGTYTYEEIVEDENYIYHHIYTLELTVIPPEIVVLPEEAYDSYEWHGEVYTESGVYTYEEWCYQEILELTIIPSTETAVDNMQTDSDHSAQKILRDQQILILRDGKIYTIMGAEVK